jgi:hypothetical protein
VPATDPTYGDTDGDGFVEYVSADPDPDAQALIVWNGTGAIEGVIPFGGLSAEPQVTAVHLVDVDADGTHEILVLWRSTAAGEYGSTLYGSAATSCLCWGSAI